MEYAISIYKGGKRVYAKDCDFVSYSEQGLICPICKQEVYLRNGNIREPYFAHFHATSSRQVEQCQLRVSTDGNSTETSSLIENRGQRLEIFQQHFLSLIYFENSKIIEDVKFNNWIASIKRDNNQAINNIANDCIEYFLTHQKQMEVYCVYLKDAQPLLQQQIALEAIDYLCVKSSYRLLKYIIYYCIYQLDKQNFTKNNIDSICHRAIKIIMLNPWIKALDNSKSINSLTINASQLFKPENDRVKPTTVNRVNSGIIANWSMPFEIKLERGQYLADKLGTNPVQVQVAMENQLLVMYQLGTSFTRSDEVKAAHSKKSFSTKLTQERSKLLTIGTIELGVVPIYKWEATQPQYETLAKLLNKSTKLPDEIKAQYRGLVLTNEELTIGSRVLCKKNKLGNKEIVSSCLAKQYMSNNQVKPECVWIDQIRLDITKKMLQANYQQVKKNVDNYLVNNSDEAILKAKYQVKKVTQAVRSAIRHNQPGVSESDCSRLALLISEYIFTKLNLNYYDALGLVKSFKTNIPAYKKLRDKVIQTSKEFGHLKEDITPSSVFYKSTNSYDTTLNKELNEYGIYV